MIIIERIVDDTQLTLTVRGNYTNGNYINFPTDLLYEKFKDQIGQEINLIAGEARIITSVSKSGDFVYIDTIRR